MDMTEIKKALTETFGPYNDRLQKLETNVIDLGQKLAGRTDVPAGHGGGRIRPQHGVQFAFAGGDFTEPRRPMLRPEENRHAIMQRC